MPGEERGVGRGGFLARPAPWLVVLLVALISALALVPRIGRENFVVTEGGVHFWDFDTIRRLERIEHLVNPKDPYPYCNSKDGYPGGSVIHWTLPMDWVILALDRVAPASYPSLRPHEAGAMWAGPVLGALSILLFALLSLRWLGPWPALAATFLYAFSTTTVMLTSLGNGDHQNLQHLFLIGAILGMACLLSGRGGGWMSAWIGVAMGMALWVSTESMAALVLLCAAAFLALLLEPRARRAKFVRLHLTWGLCCLAICALAAALEQPGHWPAYEWDKISGFQLHQVLIFTLFLVLVAALDRRLRGARWHAPVLAAAAALVLGALPFLMSSALRAAFAHQLELLAQANAWTQTMVQEYMPLFSQWGVVRLGEPIARFTILFYALPLLVPAFLLRRRLPLSARLGMGLVFLGFLGLTLAEVKLGHMLVLLYPAVIILGGAWWLELCLRRAAPRRLAAWAGGAALLGIALWQGPAWTVRSFPSHRVVGNLMDYLHGLAAPAVAARPGEPAKTAVLASWGLGADIMYYADKPVVASNYHRNLAGIHDAFRILLSPSFERAEALLRRRGVRWIVIDATPTGFIGVERMLPGLGKAADPVQVRTPGGALVMRPRFQPLVARSIYWKLRTRRGDPRRFRLTSYDCPLKSPLPGRGKAIMVRYYLVYQVVYPEER